MTGIVRAADRHFSDFGWLRTYWLFSFADYFDPRNIQFGALRVFNDDVVQPGTGFPTHPHEEMEIVTLVLDGEMTHEDSMGNRTAIRAGDVQRMSAGTGLTHSEFNLGERPVHFFQIWVFPDRAGLEPSYDQRTFEPAHWRNRLAPVASGQGLPGAVTFHADATIYRSALDAGRSAGLDATAGRRLFLYVVRGALEVGDQRLGEADQARIDPDGPLRVEAATDAEFVLIDVPSCRGWGYSRETLRGSRRAGR
jgi:redox-sensitive bicupin YhaK (pirin superfamily)